MDERPDAGRSRPRRLIPLVALGAMGLLQLVPYGWAHDNPPVVDDAPWPSRSAAEIARSACYDCHSNESEWPLYSYVAPMSWLVRRDVDEGRDRLNFSEWDDHESRADDAAEAILDGSMPPGRYTLVHRDAVLDESEKDVLVAALMRMDD